MGGQKKLPDKEELGSQLPLYSPFVIKSVVQEQLKSLNEPSVLSSP